MHKPVTSHSFFAIAATPWSGVVR